MAVAGPDHHSAATASAVRVVEAFAEDDQLTAGERPPLRPGAVAGVDVDGVAVGDEPVVIVKALSGVAGDRFTNHRQDLPGERHRVEGSGLVAGGDVHAVG